MREAEEPSPPVTPLPTPAAPQPDADARETWPFVERRSGIDRRQQPTRWYSFLLPHRRRRRGRRKGESQSIYVDVFETADVVLVGAVFVLNLADAGLTLYHLSQGLVEQNPFMDQILRYGTGWFLVEKSVVVGLCMGALLVHSRFPIARCGAYALLALYSLLLLKHLSLFF